MHNLHNFIHSGSAIFHKHFLECSSCSHIVEWYSSWHPLQLQLSVLSLEAVLCLPSTSDINVERLLFCYCTLWRSTWNLSHRLAVPRQSMSKIWSWAKHVQVAQLSQKDRAAGWVNFGQKWKTIFCILYRSIFNHCDVAGLQSYRIRWNGAKWKLEHRSRSFKVTDVGTNRQTVCDFLLAISVVFTFVVINSNLHPILSRTVLKLSQIVV